MIQSINENENFNLLWKHLTPSLHISINFINIFRYFSFLSTQVISTNVSNYVCYQEPKMATLNLLFVFTLLVCLPKQQHEEINELVGLGEE